MTFEELDDAKVKGGIWLLVGNVLVRADNLFIGTEYALTGSSSVPYVSAKFEDFRLATPNDMLKYGE